MNSPPGFLPPRTRSRSERGVVLPLVLILSLVLGAAVTTFVRRAVIDTMIVRNRDNVAVAEALARSGVHIARAVLHEQLQRKIDVAFQRGDSEETVGNTVHDLTARIGQYELETEEGAIMRVSIFDNRARLNLNSLVRYATAEKAQNIDGLAPALLLDQLGTEVADLVTSQLSENEIQTVADNAKAAGHLDGMFNRASVSKDEEGKPIADAEEYLVDFFDRVIENMDTTAAEKEYDTRDLARNLLDYMDYDQIRIGGGNEDSYYQAQDPPYFAANKPILSVKELGLIEGFDYNLVSTLEPYLTVYPLFAAEGVNVNTAPRHVLGSILQGNGSSRRLLSEENVAEMIRVREDGSFFCDDTAKDPDRCVSLTEASIDGSIYPPTELPARSWVYTVFTQVVYGDIERNVEAVINMTKTGKDIPFLLYWRMQ
jgi:type II secretory pathway component PulK